MAPSGIVRSFVSSTYSGVGAGSSSEDSSELSSEDSSLDSSEDSSELSGPSAIFDIPVIAEASENEIPEAPVAYEAFVTSGTDKAEEALSGPAQEAVEASEGEAESAGQTDAYTDPREDDAETASIADEVREQPLPAADGVSFEAASEGEEKSEKERLLKRLRFYDRSSN